ncbi:MAG: hypothetical protein G01um101430_76 [Parcubacteria group bacterium Gr01-1014_30]|nr:MAG: hypothetical protein G01um101430_76 [Parcubacteria group bacterium Gr01-1014_30]
MAFNKKLIIISLLLASAIIAGAVFAEQIAKLGQKIENRLEVYAQTTPLYFMPRFPDRLSFMVSELAIASQELEYLGSTLSSGISDCGCQNAASECFDCNPGRVLGDPCPQRRQIERDQFDLEIKADQVVFLRRLLEKELEISLQRELATLRQDDAQNLESYLDDILSQIQTILDSSRSISDLSQTTTETISQCGAQCGSVGGGFGWRACVGLVSQQKPWTVKWSAGVALSDLELGGVQIRNINLGLPQEITTPRLPDLPSFAVQLPTVQINFPETPLGQAINLAPQPVVFRPPSPQVPLPPTLTLSCPSLPNLSSSYQWPDSQEQETIAFTPSGWEDWFQTFETLRGMCLNVLLFTYGGNHSFDYFNSPEYAACQDPPQVSPTLTAMCNSLLVEYQNCINNPPIVCVPPPPECDSPPPDFDPQLSDSSLEQGGGSATATSQTIGNFPKSTLDCPVSPPTIPKIRFPDIIIPDVVTPDFRVWPFIDIKLPNFIFEDLILPDLYLCDINNCSNLFPDLRFQTPFLNIPEVALPAICLPQAPIFAPGAGNVSVIMPCVGINNIKYPVMPYISYQLFNLGNLLTPEVELQGIEFPLPRLTFAFRGVDIDFIGLLLGLFLPPLPSGCLSFDVLGLPLRVHFDDVIFSWPSFPQVPEIPFCSEINQFCRQIRLNMADVTSKVGQIQNIVNNVMQTQMQTRLNTGAQTINQRIAQAIQDQLEARAQKVREKIEEHVRLNARVVAGKVQVSPLTIQLDPIVIPQLSLQSLLGIPATIQIPWPENLKRVLLSRPITYQLPKVPLSQLSYETEFDLKIPGFQMARPIATLGPLRGGCEAQAPSGGNPYPVGQIDLALSGLTRAKNQIEETSQNIIDILR